MKITYYLQYRGSRYTPLIYKTNSYDLYWYESSESVWKLSCWSLELAKYRKDIFREISEEEANTFLMLKELKK